MLERWLATLSRTTIAVGAIVLGTFFIVLSDPPHTVCDVQSELLEKEIGKFFFLTAEEKRILDRNRFTRSLDDCRQQNSPGGCYQFFSILAVLERELENLPNECVREIGVRKEIKEALWSGAELIVHLAWGETAPDTHVVKTGWLTPADVMIFCRVKRQALRGYGQEAWKSFEEQYFKKLPGASELPRDEAWSRMILSVPCHTYL